ncbi:MAG TPA: hypothetical protein VML75_00515 [Kofleriaceae bacterium]|nr:hypothetical protein [Kofleriaceae bacterium]
MISRGFTVVVAGAAALLGTGPVAAGPHSEVASAFDEGDEFDLHVTIDYELDSRRATIRREQAGLPGTGPDDPIPLVDDLRFESLRHTLTPRLELSIFTDLAITFALPIIIRDTRSLSLDGIAPGASTTISDGLLPATGFDANDPTGPGFTNANDSMIFRGPARAGLDQVHVGMVWAPMNQARDDTKPTWKLGAALRVPVGGIMKFDRMDPEGDTGVGRGLWEVHIYTTIAKQLTWAEPFVEMWWTAPFKHTDDSPFVDPGFGSKRTNGQQHAGTRFGLEAYLFNDKESKQRVSLELSTSLRANFEGRAYSEMWEIFSYAGDARTGGPLVLDADPTRPGIDALSHPGISNVENYLTLGGRVGIGAQLGEKVRFGASVALTHDQSHLISFADAGVDKPTCRAGQVPPACEVSSNEVVDPGTDEVNPLHVQTIDQVGGRYRLDGADDFLFLVDARVLF